jgi:predicted RNA-binding Zn-ribbon protein involved in translation (DUF1610 family)
MDEDDEKDNETDPIHQQLIQTPRHHNKTLEQDFQAGFPLPYTGLWRFFSDQIAREGVQKANQTPACRQVNTTSVLTPPRAPDTTLDDESQEEHSTHAPFIENHSRNESDHEEEHSSHMILFQDTFSETQRDSSSYLDPELDEIWRRSHSNEPPSDLPKIVKVPSEESLKDAPKQVSIEGRKKAVRHGMVEVNPGEFVRIHGKRHAQSAIEKGQSTIVKCDTCHKKFQVDKKATALYCTNCNSVTRLNDSTLDST